ncbi:hypothetical protein [Nonomuraea guangzhouensis]|uniref:hypothetical protein n=1 Tax=Nonomuraea guangzhouensis TaxID=1291555 RepID=UPI001C5F8318|nr:hypothetical protein [Nonomuraea guangzhouensis]
MTNWEPYQRAKGERLRVTETSCCGEYEWACQGGEFLILRYNGSGYEETGRGRYAARKVWEHLVQAHKVRATRRRASPDRCQDGS